MLGLYPVPVFALKRPIQWQRQPRNGTDRTGLLCSALSALPLCLCVLLGLSRRCPHTSLQHASCSSQMLSLLPPLLLPLRMFVLFSLVFCGLSPVCCCCCCCFFSVYWCVCFCVCVSLPLCVCVSVFVCVCLCVVVCHFMRFLLDAFVPPAATLCREWKFSSTTTDDNERLVVARGEFRPRRALPLPRSLFLAVSLFFASKLN